MSLPYEDNQKDRVPYEHYLAEFAGIDPVEASLRTGIPYDVARQVFTLELLNQRYEIRFPDFAVVSLGEGYAPLADRESFGARIFVLRYLIRGKKTVAGGRYITYGEMPWGEVYIRQFTGRCIMRLAFGFGFKLDKFASACEQLSGERLTLGDVSYELNILGNLSIRFILWEGDDEFPPSAQILFSDNFVGACEAEDLCVACDISINAMKALGK